VVVLDEPTTGLDARGVELVSSLIRELVAEGRSVVGISHDMRFVAQTFERVAVLEGGQITAQGTTQEVFAQAQWPTLRAAGLEPTAAALIGARLGLGSTPTEGALVEALRRER
jgi:energy-coupling factor transport system ATP-binding protein